MKLNINKDSILVVDLDQTLIFTNEANLLSYAEAIENILGIDFATLSFYALNGRFTFDSIKEILPNIQKDELELIKAEKIKNYKKYLKNTQINEDIIKCVLKFYNKNTIILLTNASRCRIRMLLKFYNLDFFSHIFFNKKGNKYRNLIEFFKLDAEKLIIFEDDKNEIKNALSVGILKENIMEISNE
jgi:hydrolase|nr:HAD hydrolase-like protein [uncultured Campylobacter sp.]